MFRRAVARVPARWHTLDVTESHWCDQCALPSVARVVGALTIATTPMVVRVWMVCRDCGGVTHP